jgi:two-component system LytT family response regulator
MTTYRVLIVEDERHQLEMLTLLLTDNFPELQLIATASSVDEGKELIDREKPDLVFLDVRLGNESSFDLLSTLNDIPFEIIFTTSFEEYAVRAFRLSAVDYLLKPVAKDDLISAVEKFKQRRLANETAKHVKTLLENISATKAGHKKIALPTLTGFIFVTVKDIIRCESDNTYTTFFTTDKRKIVVSKTLKDCEQILSGCGFFRVHNSHLINIDCIAEYTKGEGGLVKMTDGSHVDISRRRKDEFLRFLKQA